MFEDRAHRGSAAVSDKGIYIDPAGDVDGVYHDFNGYVPTYNLDKMPGNLRRVGKYLAGQ